MIDAPTRAESDEWEELVAAAVLAALSALADEYGDDVDEWTDDEWADAVDDEGGFDEAGAAIAAWVFAAYEAEGISPTSGKTHSLLKWRPLSVSVRRGQAAPYAT